MVLGSSIGPLTFSITNGGEADLHLTGSLRAVLTGNTDQFSLGGSPSTTLGAG